MHWAGWVRANATIRFGSGFTVTRTANNGSYRITIPPTASAKPIILTATSGLAAAHAVVVAYTLNPDGSHSIDIETHRANTGAFMDADFTFIAVEES
jgi:hypothetical protein